MRYRFLQPSKRANQHGFTIPELLIAVGVVVLIAAVGVTGLKPVSQDTAIKDAERRTDVAWMAQALKRYKVANGQFPAGIPAKAQYIGSDNGEFNLCNIMVPAYLRDIPKDPDSGLRYKGSNLNASTADPCTTKDLHYYSGYTIAQSASGAVTLAAPSAKADHVSITLQQ